MRSLALRNRLVFVSACLLVSSVASVVGCGQSGDHAGTAEAQSKREPLPKATAPAGKVVVAYLALQQALAFDDAAAARKAFGQVKAAADDPTAIADAALRVRISAAAQAGVDTKDLVSARKAFEPLTRSMLELLRAQANPVSAALHVAHCPMAFDNAGADWLQTSSSVANPYFGSEMFGCGSLGAEVKPGQKLVAK